MTDGREARRGRGILEMREMREIPERRELARGSTGTRLIRAAGCRHSMMALFHDFFAGGGG